jgi:uncharacterized membrane-anchored protein YjiN (DUF445 family)
LTTVNTSIAQSGLIIADEALKRARLSSMQWIATSLLGAMLALLLVSAFFGTTYPWLRWVQAFAEAAVVGAIADWFAVVALFRHPLGLPIPHTAIVPRNKDDIGESLGKFVEHNFLTPQNVMRRLGQTNLAHAGAQWLARRDNSKRAAANICALIPRILDMIDDEDVRQFLERTVGPQLDKLNLSRVAGEALEIVTAGDHHLALLDRGLKAIERLVTANRDLIVARFGDYSKYTPGFLDAYIVDKFVAGIVRLLHDAALDPGHPIRLQFAEATREFIEKLKTSPDFHARGEVIKRDLIDHVKGEQYYRRIWEHVERRILADLTGADSQIEQYLTDALVALGDGLLNDAPMQQKLNAWTLKALEALMLTHRHQISSLITDIVKSWDAKEISKKVELEIGKDLQYIRLNGTLVGGSVGVLLHAVTSVIA